MTPAPRMFAAIVPVDSPFCAVVVSTPALARVETTGLSISRMFGELPCWPASSAWVVSAVVS